MELSEAKYLAENAVAKLAPFCERISIAGSIRRQKPNVGDIELLVIPNRMPQRDIFGKVIGEHPVQGFCEVVNQWKKIKGDPTGKYTQRRLPEGINLDLFIAHKDNWGYLLVVRTGSSDFSKKVAGRWVKFGYRGVDGMLTDNGRPISIPEEMDLFRILGMEYIEPKDRI